MHKLTEANTLRQDVVSETALPHVWEKHPPAWLATLMSRLGFAPEPYDWVDMLGVPGCRYRWVRKTR